MFSVTGVLLVDAIDHPWATVSNELKFDGETAYVYHEFEVVDVTELLIEAVES